MTYKKLVELYENRIKNVLSCKNKEDIDKNAFIRNRKMNFDDIIKLLLGRKGLSLSMELFNYSKKTNKDGISKQDLSKQRKKIHESFFIKAMHTEASDFYKENNYKTYNGYTVTAIDGSKLILPRCKELEEKYGLANANNSQQKCVQSLLSGCYDCLNNIMLDVQIGPYASDEREYAKKNIDAVINAYKDLKFLFIFDRGYPSIDMLNFMDKRGLKYLIRLQNSTYEKEKKELKSNDEEINLVINETRLAGKMDKEVRKELRKKGFINTRLAKYELSNGNTEWLITNLTKEEADLEKLGELYFDRWQIEIAYNTLKNKLQIENFSGKSDLTIRQDIYSTIIIYNMIEETKMILEKNIKQNKKNKYTYKINENILIGEIKNIFIEVVVTENKKTKYRLFKLLEKSVVRCKTANIPNRSYKREFKGGSLKCKVNLKRVF